MTLRKIRQHAVGISFSCVPETSKSNIVSCRRSALKMHAHTYAHMIGSPSKVRTTRSGSGGGDGGGIVRNSKIENAYMCTVAWAEL